MDIKIIDDIKTKYDEARVAIIEKFQSALNDYFDNIEDDTKINESIKINKNNSYAVASSPKYFNALTESAIDVLNAKVKKSDVKSIIQAFEFPTDIFAENFMALIDKINEMDEHIAALREIPSEDQRRLFLDILEYKYIVRDIDYFEDYNIDDACLDAAEVIFSSSISAVIESRYSQRAFLSAMETFRLNERIFLYIWDIINTRKRELYEIILMDNLTSIKNRLSQNPPEEDENSN